jgi:hypothetical protein
MQEQKYVFNCAAVKAKTKNIKEEEKFSTEETCEHIRYWLKDPMRNKGHAKMMIEVAIISAKNQDEVVKQIFPGIDCSDFNSPEHAGEFVSILIGYRLNLYATSNKKETPVQESKSYIVFSYPVPNKYLSEIKNNLSDHHAISLIDGIFKSVSLFTETHLEETRLLIEAIIVNSENQHTVVQSVFKQTVGVDFGSSEEAGEFVSDLIQKKLAAKTMFVHKPSHIPDWVEELSKSGIIDYPSHAPSEGSSQLTGLRERIRGMIKDLDIKFITPSPEKIMVKSILDSDIEFNFRGQCVDPARLLMIKLPKQRYNTSVEPKAVPENGNFDGDVMGFDISKENKLQECSRRITEAWFSMLPSLKLNRLSEKQIDALREEFIKENIAKYNTKEDNLAETSPEIESLKKSMPISYPEALHLIGKHSIDSLAQIYEPIIPGHFKIQHPYEWHRFGIPFSPSSMFNFVVDTMTKNNPELSAEPLDKKSEYDKDINELVDTWLTHGLLNKKVALSSETLDGIRELLRKEAIQKYPLVELKAEIVNETKTSTHKFDLNDISGNLSSSHVVKYTGNEILISYRYPDDIQGFYHKWAKIIAPVEIHDQVVEAYKEYLLTDTKDNSGLTIMNKDKFTAKVNSLGGEFKNLPFKTCFGSPMIELIMGMNFDRPGPSSKS